MTATTASLSVNDDKGEIVDGTASMSVSDDGKVYTYKLTKEKYKRWIRRKSGRLCKLV